MTNRSGVSLPDFERSIDTSAGVTNVSAQGGSIAVSANGGAFPVVASMSGDVRVTAGNLPLQVSAAGGSFAVSANGGSLPTLASVSGDVRVTAGNSPLPVLASISGDVKVTAPNAITVSANTGTMNVSAQNGALPVAQRSDYLWSGPLKASAKYAALDLSSNVCADVISGTSGRKIRVLSGFIISAGTVQATFCATGAFTKLTGGMNLGRGYTMPYTPLGHFETPRGSALSVQLGAAVSAAGALTYVLVSG